MSSGPNQQGRCREPSLWSASGPQGEDSLQGQVWSRVLQLWQERLRSSFELQVRVWLALLYIPCISLFICVTVGSGGKWEPIPTPDDHLSLHPHSLTPNPPPPKMWKGPPYVLIGGFSVPISFQVYRAAVCSLFRHRFVRLLSSRNASPPLEQAQGARSLPIRWTRRHLTPILNYLPCLSPLPFPPTPLIWTS